MSWGNEPLKKWYFNFGGLFLSQKWSYIKKLNGIGFSNAKSSTSANLNNFQNFVWPLRPSNSLPPVSPPFLPPISPRLLSHFFNSISDGAVIHISPVWFQAYLQLAAMYWLWFSLNIGKIRSVLLYIHAVCKEDDPSSSAAPRRALPCRAVASKKCS